MRAIDADALQLAIVEEGQANKRKKYIIGDIWELTGAEIREVINSQPTIQPEIVRCKDCKHFIREDIEEYAPYGFYNTYFHAFCDKHWDKEQGEYIDVNLDDFCSRGERREDG